LFPLYDVNRSRTRSFITWMMIIVNVLVFFWQLGRSFANEDFFYYGAIPGEVMSGGRLYTLVTSMFMHGGLVHIFGNMLYLFIFGDNVEDRFGHAKYFVIYLVFGIVAGLTHSWFSVQSGGEEASIPAVGASGAISGVLGAYVLLYPKARIVTLVFLGFFVRVIRVPSIFFLGFWFIFQFLQGLVNPFSGVAYWAHIGGFVIGFLVAIPFKISGNRRARSW
jgi:membrane associated rhomboid family serine protease